MSGENENENEDLTENEPGGNTGTVEPGNTGATEDPESDGTQGGPSPEGELPNTGTEGEESTGTEDEPAADEAPAPEAKIDELAQFRQELAALKAERQVLLDLVKNQTREPQAIQPPPNPNSDVPTEAVIMAMYGVNDTNAWNALSPNVREKALKVARAHMDREALKALNPDAQDEVEDRVMRRVAPLVEDYHSRRAREVREKHIDSLKDPVAEQRARELYSQMPGAGSHDWRDIERAVKAAATQARLEMAERKSKEQEIKEKAKKVQKGSAGGTKIKASTGPSGAAPKFSWDNPPPIQPGERLSDYTERLNKLLG
jgi:hypothetical protein